MGDQERDADCVEACEPVSTGVSASAQVVNLDDRRLAVASTSQLPGKPSDVLQPKEEVGRRVLVVGDGWGSESDQHGARGYEAIVTDADEHSFTVVSIGK